MMDALRRTIAELEARNGRLAEKVGPLATELAECGDRLRAKDAEIARLTALVADLTQRAEAAERRLSDALVGQATVEQLWREASRDRDAARAALADFVTTLSSPSPCPPRTRESGDG